MCMSIIRIDNMGLIRKKISLEDDNLTFNLVFHSSLTLIRGNSGIGKTYLFNMLAKEALLDANSNIICLNYMDLKSGHIKMVLNAAKNKVIIIDNADVVLDDEDRMKINFDTDNQYILFMRKFGCLKPSGYSFANLVIDKNKGYLSYPVIENEKKMKQKHKKWMEMNSDSYLA